MTISALWPNNINDPCAVSDEPVVTLMPLFLSTKSAAPRRLPLTSGPAAGQPKTSLEEERREIVASVLGALAGNTPDPDEVAACSRLLKHLADTAGGCPPRAA
jgi:hypothetical protein